MDKRQTVESGIRRKGLQGARYGDRYETRSSVFRSRSSPVSSPTSSQAPSKIASSTSSRTSSLIRSISSVQIARRLTQFKQIPAQVSRSIVRYPYAWLGATWLGLVLIGSVATVVLLRIDPTNPEPAIAVSPVDPALSPILSDESHLFPAQAGFSQEDLRAAQDEAFVSEPAPIASNSIQRQRGSSLPLFALGTVAFSCAIGCLLLSYRFSAQAPKVQTRLLTRSQRLPRSTSPSLPQVAAKRAEAAETELRSSHAEASAGISVAIVSPNESHPLDWDEPSLADNLDIRQRHPLSRWL